MNCRAGTWRISTPATGRRPVEYSEQEVRPKEGYDRIDWDASARLIWGPDLEQSNTLLCRLTVE